MLYKLLFTACLCFIFTGNGFAQSNHKTQAVIFDTDMGPDYDDVGAIALLHALADRGEAHILATIASNKYEGIAAVLNVFNTYFGRPAIPIGVPKGKAVDMRDNQHWTDTILKKYPHEVKANADAPDAIDLYRKILAAQPDTSVTLITVGFLTNLANLLTSGPDQYSSMNGRELIRKKVKQLITMGGAFPSGKEFNLYNDAKASAIALPNWPTRVIFSGFEIGKEIKTGLPLIHNNTIQNDPVKDVFALCIPMSPQDAEGRMSWDETAVLTAIRGYNQYFTLKEGRIIMNGDGSNRWDNNGKGQFYLVQKESSSVVADVINQLMMHVPEK